MIEDVSQKWLVHITGKLPVTATLNGHDYWISVSRSRAS